MYLVLIQKMFKVFSSAEKPKINEITPHRCKECDEIRDRFHPFKQSELPDELIAEFEDGLPLLSPKALRYFIPRYLEFGLLNQDHMAFEMCLYELSPKEIDTDYHRQRIAIFTEEEKSILREYLQLARNLDSSKLSEVEIERGLKFWA